MCQGLRLCPNGNDLKWCRNATSWSIPAGWKPLFERSDLVNCNDLEATDKDPRGQLIEKVNVKDGLNYHCLNRRDEDPFLKKANSSETGQKSWLENFETACPEKFRRCLGNRADECVGKYNISR